MINLESVAVPEAVHEKLRRHLLRSDGQEDICLALWNPSTGRRRVTRLISQEILPFEGERMVHGNASLTGDFVFRGAALAEKLGHGLAIAHSHPLGVGHQGMSGADYAAEQSFAGLVSEITGLPLVGLTLAGDGNWSARTWYLREAGPPEPIETESVRVLGEQLRVCWNPKLRPPPSVETTQIRTVSSWGSEAQADLARRHVCVVGVGSVGLDVVLRIAASGVERMTVIDPDRVERHNLDRLIGASRADAEQGILKVELAEREARKNATAASFEIETIAASIGESAALHAALDADLIFSCVDRPWPRAILNQIAYSDLIPVIDGGIGIETFGDGRMRSATWRSHVIRPGRPCMICNGQLDPSKIALDRSGLLDDPTYLEGAGVSEVVPSQNVAVLSVCVAALMLGLYTSFSVAPGGFGDPGPLQYNLATHDLDLLEVSSLPDCAFEAEQTLGDRRTLLAEEESSEQDG